MTADAFGTAALRAAVLGAWRASPARLREDANTEEDHAHGYYRDRVLVELAQNAADAATRADVPGRLLLRLARADDGTIALVAANTGAPLDAEGVASLSSMRASSKRDTGARVVGRFGVGFAAVRAVADEVSLLSTTGGVRFSARDTAELLSEAAADVPALAEEVRRRDGSLPSLRLPLPADGRPPEGYDTAVVLQLRDEVFADEVRVLLREVGDPLLLALPGLVEILVEDHTSDAPARRIADVHERWVVESAEGELSVAVVADRPVEERSARSWRVTWAVPRDPALSWLPVVHAPTPTDEPCSVPALFVATLPLDPTRRHVAAGRLADVVLEHAADAYARLAQARADADADPLSLVPTGLAAGTLDATLRDLVVERLARTPLLRRAAPSTSDLVAPDRAVMLAGGVGTQRTALAALGRRIAGLVVVPSGRQAQARTLGVEERSLADVVEELPVVDDGTWAELYDALEPVADDSQAREALGALPVPLADGRVVRGARGLVVLDP
ncbi:sacsin N-terminal ATP-binding-like domain-containing protein, partial [uncultured Cellulomonas sp.]|uniref:sacsin N-terminal ATP-binding-like domain-containing protein n=1 Tax=uncultured Cellulomonas sp. TaxID=189682 RepID=UPI0037DD303F